MKKIRATATLKKAKIYFFLSDAEKNKIAAETMFSIAAIKTEFAWPTAGIITNPAASEPKIPPKTFTENIFHISLPRLSSFENIFAASGRVMPIRLAGIIRIKATSNVERTSSSECELEIE